MVSAKHEHAAIRVWCAGSASGEEAYSIAMLLVRAHRPHRSSEIA